MVQQNAVNENANSDLNISFIASIKVTVHDLTAPHFINLSYYI